jgi:hypothetical protein
MSEQMKCECGGDIFDGGSVGLYCSRGFECSCGLKFETPIDPRDARIHELEAQVAELKLCLAASENLRNPIYRPQSTVMGGAPIDSTDGYTISVRLSAVYLDSLTPLIPAYVIEGQTWNGWAIPYFTRENADIWLKHQVEFIEANRGDAAKMMAYYNAEKDLYFASVDLDGDGECCNEDVTKGEDFTDEAGNILHLYPIGVYNWCWIEQD